MQNSKDRKACKVRRERKEMTNFAKNDNNIMRKKFLTIFPLIFLFLGMGFSQGNAISMRCSQLGVLANMGEISHICPTNVIWGVTDFMVMEGEPMDDKPWYDGDDPRHHIKAPGLAIYETIELQKDAYLDGVHWDYYGSMKEDGQIYFFLIDKKEKRFIITTKAKNDTSITFVYIIESIQETSR